MEDGTIEIVKHYPIKAFWGDDLPLGDFTIPKSVDGRTVTKIGHHAFANLGIRTLRITDSLRSIDGNPFWGNEIYHFHVSDDNPYFATIDNVLFSKPDKRLIMFPRGAHTKDLKMIKDYEIPNGIQIISEEAFTDMEPGSSISIPSTVDSILSNPAEGFLIKTILSPANKNLQIINNCLIRKADGKLITGRPSNYPAGKESWDLRQIDRKNLTCRIPDCVKIIGKKAFRGSGSDCTSVSIPQSVEVIEDEAFRDCFNIRSITIPNSVTSIGKGVFSGCSKLKEIELPSSIPSIPNDTFLKCNELTTVAIPNGVTSIEKGAFCDCLKLTEVTIPQSVKMIDANAFSSAYDLTVHVVKDSFAHKYCEKHRIKFDYPGYSEPDKLAWLK